MTVDAAHPLIIDFDGRRVTGFATNSATGQLPDLELRHRRLARAEDRIRIAGHRPDQPAPLTSSPRTWTVETAANPSDIGETLTSTRQDQNPVDATTAEP